MRWVSGGVLGLARGLATILIVGPVLALGLGAVVDRGADGTVGGTPFHLALAVFDPFVWVSVGNSLAVALGVTAGSLVLGVGLARAAIRWRFWGRGPLLVLGGASLAVPPLFGAIGLSWFLDRSGVPGLSPGVEGAWGGWLALVWLGLTGGVVRVALAASAALSRIEPGWGDAARLEGASPRRVWWSVVWPLARPGTARAAAQVFLFTLLEPGAPWVLGLRRTLAFQVIEAAQRPNCLPRAAALGLLGLALAWAGRTLIHAWGRSSAPLPAEPVGRPGRAPWTRAAVLTALGIGWTVVALLPMLGLVGGALGPGEGEHPSVRPGSWGDPEVLGLIAHSILLGLAVGGITLVLALGQGFRTNWRPESSRRSAPWSKGIPPLAVGVGALCLPWLLGAMADVLDATVGTVPARLSRSVAGGLDPYRTPLLLVWAVAVVRLPMLRRAVEEALGRSRPALAEAAVNLGASRRLAWWGTTGRGIGAALVAPLALTVALAASDAAPSLVLTPTAASRTIGPGVALLTDRSEGRRAAAALAAIAVVGNLVAMALVARRGGGRSLIS